MKNILSFLQEHTPDILADVETLVRIETPSNYTEGINRLQHITQNWLNELGQVMRHPSQGGDVIHARLAGQSSERVLLLAHVDTVYPVGAWSDPWSVKEDRAYGPGTYDMKAGLVQALWALRALRARNQKASRTIDLLVTPDEEVGSRIGLPFIQSLARGARAVLVLEAPFMNGDLKIARKGVGDYNIQVHGKAAHQGVEPEKGRNAIVSAAHVIDEIVKLQDFEKGTTLGPNVITGGTASNVVADHVDLAVDLRAWTEEEADRVDSALKAIQPLEGTRYEISGGLNRPPMEPSDGSFQLLEKAQRIAAELGFKVGAARVGGGSDGNFTAKLAPTLDGFGAFGANAHQKDMEYIHIPSLAPRTALLAGMLLG
ncbi:MAG TPA: M20 family metallopeptidase [Anaerolineales bacterium]|nr:M20 family metallopeptidase [Anaerolineales bacterium]